MVTISAAIAGTNVQGLSVVVTGPGIPTPVVANIPATGATASGTISVPTGRQRDFTVRGFDAAGIQTHEGSATADIRPGSNPTVAVTLYPLTAGAPVTVTVGSYLLTLSPGDGSLAIGATRQYSATVVRDDGTPVSDPTIVWGSLSPTLASVSTTGLVTALGTGATRIVASFGGAAAEAALTITSAAATPAAGDWMGLRLDDMGTSAPVMDDEARDTVSNLIVE